MSSKRIDASCKILILGESKVGKSSILNRFTEKTYAETLPPTLGIDYKITKMNVSGFDLKMQIWDTAGQERFRSITESFYKGCQAVLLVFDLSDRETFNKIKNWLANINEKAGTGVLIVLLGNKCDLVSKSEIELVNQEEIDCLVNALNIKYFATSAKEDINIHEAFYYIAKIIIEKEKESNALLDNDLRISKIPSNGSSKCCNTK